MLIVGDLSYKQINPAQEVESIDILVAPENKPNLLKQLDLIADAKIPVGEYTELYMKRGVKIPYIITTTDMNIYMRFLLRQNMAETEGQLRVASPPVNYMYMAGFVGHRFYDAISWVKIVKQVNELEKHFYYHYRDPLLQEKMLKVADRISKSFSGLSFINSKPQTILGYEKYSKFELLAAMGCKIDSAYKRITVPMNDNYFNQERFMNEYSDVMKKLALMEGIYLHMINNYLIPEQVLSGKYPPASEWTKMFIHSAMDFITDTQNEYKTKLQSWALHNLLDLIQSYRADVLLSYIRAEESGQIKPKQAWLDIYQN